MEVKNGGGGGGGVGEVVKECITFKEDKVHVH